MQVRGHVAGNGNVASSRCATDVPECAGWFPWVRCEGRDGAPAGERGMIAKDFASTIIAGVRRACRATDAPGCGAAQTTPECGYAAKARGRLSSSLRAPARQAPVRRETTI
jgi:hypothetical protein